jgi:CheY-like chemotaxis protein
MEKKPPPPSIVVASGDSIVVEVLAHTLGHFTVVTAATSEEAILRAAARKPSLVILDANLPGIPWIRACTILKSDPAFSSIPIMVLAPRDAIGAPLSSPAPKADCYLAKPFSPPELRKMADFLVGTRTVPPEEPRPGRDERPTATC